VDALIIAVKTRYQLIRSSSKVADICKKKKKWHALANEIVGVLVCRNTRPLGLCDLGKCVDHARLHDDFSTETKHGQPSCGFSWLLPPLVLIGCALISGLFSRQLTYQLSLVSFHADLTNKFSGQLAI
jgi:hypothetical protein